MQTLLEAQNRKRRFPFLYLGTGSLIFMSLAFVLYPAERTSLARTDLHLGTVQRGPIVRQIKAPGRFVPNSQTWITARVDARVKSKLLEPGATVSADTIILELSAPELTQDYRRALLEVKVAQAKLQAVRAQQQNDYRQQSASVERAEARHIR